MTGRIAVFVTSPALLRLVAVAGVVGWLVAFPIYAFTQPVLAGPGAQPLGGDFVAFYTAGRIVLDGRAPQLYDLETLQDAQRAVLGAPQRHGLIAYANPPSVAAGYAGLAWLPYRAAYVVCTLAHLAAFLAAVRVVRPWLPKLREHWGTVLGLVWLFYPISRTITGGQNTALTLLLLSVAYAALRRGRAAVAGVALGLLAYKPQLVLVIGLLLLVRRQFRCLSWAVAAGIGHYLLGAALCGIWWPRDMLNMLSQYWHLENAYNGAYSVALIGWCEFWGPAGSGKRIGIVAAGLVLAVLAWVWRRADPRGETFALHWGLAVCGTVLISPHAMWYETGLLVLPVLLALHEVRRRGESLAPSGRLLLVAGFVLFPLYAWAPQLGVQPLVLLPLGILLWLGRLERVWAAPSAAPVRAV